MTQQPKHTPGPWLANACYVSGETDDISIAMCSYRGKVDYVEAEANARLIAAAPEMLEALEHMRDGYMWHVSEGRFVSELEPKIEYLSSIIRKAKGE